MRCSGCGEEVQPGDTCKVCGTTAPRGKPLPNSVKLAVGSLIAGVFILPTIFGAVSLAVGVYQLRRRSPRYGALFVTGGALLILISQLR
jgi:hypothetical protein